MSAWAWAPIAYLAFSCLYIISLIGKPRKPYTAGDVIVAEILLGGLIFCIVQAAT